MSVISKLSASLEDYLEAIFHIVKEKRAAKAKDIADRLNVNSSSVTGALQSLSKRGLVNYAPYDIITMTPEGTDVAREIIHRHETLADFLTKVLSINEDEAEETACKMEHDISSEIIERLLEFVKFVERCPIGGAKWDAKQKGFVCQLSQSDGTCEKSEECQNLIKQPKIETSVSLGSLIPGQKAKIVKLNGIDGDIRHRIVEMGMTPGSVIEVEGVAPLGDPMEIKVKGYHLSLRREEVGMIEVELLDEIYKDGLTKIPLIRIKTGEKVKFIDVNSGRRLKARLADMGLVPGTEFHVISNAPGGSLIVDVKGSRVMLGREMAGKIMVE